MTPSDSHTGQGRLVAELADEAFDALDQGDLRHAEVCLLELRKVAPDAASTHWVAAHVAWTREGASGALPWLERAARAEPTDADILYDLGRVHEALENHTEMIDCFRKVVHLDAHHDGGSLVNLRQLIAFIESQALAVLDNLPAEFADRLRHVPVVLESRPSDALVADGFDPRALGLFEGNEDRGMALGEVADRPTRVVLYYANLLATFPDQDALAEQIEVTLLHELGHFFGLGEDEVAKLGLE